MIRILLLILVLALVVLFLARFIVPLFFNKMKDDVETIKDKTKEEPVKKID